MSGKFIDAYAVLQIAPDADDAAVRARHRELAKQFHPDRGGRAADGELMMRINRARDVLLDPAARATLDEELARRRRDATPPEAAGNAPEAATGAPLSRDRRWRAEWGRTSPLTTPPPGSAAQGAAPPPAARVRPSANRLRQASRQARQTNPALSSRPRPDTPKRPRAATPPPAPQPAGPPPPNTQAAPAQQMAPQQAASHQTPPTAESSGSAWSLYSVPLDGVSVASLLASVLMCGPLGFILGIIGLARTADDRRRGRWAAVAGIAISSLTMLVAIGYVMQTMSAPSP